MTDEKVFINRVLNMKKIKFIGLDMDHTLIRYNIQEFEGLVFQMVIDYLITHKNYPMAIRQLKFNYYDAIRGLVVDCKNGNILKLSRYAGIRMSYHGTRKIDFTEQNKFYRSIYVDLGDPNYMAVDTSFSIAFCVLYEQLVDYKDKHPDILSDYQAIAHDVQFAVDIIHADGSLKKHIASDMDRFVIREKKLIDGILQYIQHGKKFFILTNSDFHYTKILLDYAINPFLPKGKTWNDLFTYVITLAGKPRFFYDNLKFLAIDPATGCMSNFFGPIKPGIYQGGNAKKFTQDLQLEGDEILYIGDHIYGDILRLKKDCNWRTALVVEELEEEIKAQHRARPIEKKINDAMKIKRDLENQYVSLHSQHTERSEAKVEKLQGQIAELDNSISKYIEEQQLYYNPKWERVFRAGAEESYFANQVERFACIYMQKLSDLLELSPITYFRANRRLLPHDF